MASQLPVEVIHPSEQSQKGHSSDAHQSQKYLHMYSSHNSQKLKKIKVVSRVVSEEKWDLGQKIMSHDDLESSEMIRSHEINPTCEIPTDAHNLKSINESNVEIVNTDLNTVAAKEQKNQSQN